MKWRKGGAIYVPDGSLWWAQIGAQLPTADLISDEVVRVYYVSKDKNGFGRPGYVDLDAADPKRILDIGREPVLDLGELGTFDDSGACPSTVISFRNQRYLYYQGFQ